MGYKGGCGCLILKSFLSVFLPMLFLLSFVSSFITLLSASCFLMGGIMRKRLLWVSVFVLSIFTSLHFLSPISAKAVYAEPLGSVPSESLNLYNTSSKVYAHGVNNGVVYTGNQANGDFQKIVFENRGGAFDVKQGDYFTIVLSFSDSKFKFQDFNFTSCPFCDRWSVVSFSHTGNTVSFVVQMVGAAFSTSYLQIPVRFVGNGSYINISGSAFTDYSSAFSSYLSSISSDVSSIRSSLGATSSNTGATAQNTAGSNQNLTEINDRQKQGNQNIEGASASDNDYGDVSGSQSLLSVVSGFFGAFFSAPATNCIISFPDTVFGGFSGDVCSADITPVSYVFSALCVVLVVGVCYGLYRNVRFNFEKIVGSA